MYGCMDGNRIRIPYQGFPPYIALTHIASDHSVQELQEEGSEEATDKDNQRPNGDTRLQGWENGTL